MKKKDLVGILVLMVGVLVGLLLVQQSQEYREKARGVEERMVLICHQTGSSREPWVEMEVAESELKDYLDAGDIIGECADLPTN
ncbi:hypothetical protein KKB40_04905 [Patescibacteria group bacterium]|nr:hypothetical protein [Patescibacteria group bacterium]